MLRQSIKKCLPIGVTSVTVTAILVVIASVISRAKETPDMPDIDKISRQIKQSEIFDRAMQYTRQIEDEVNRLVQEEISEKQAVVKGIEQDIVSQACGSAPVRLEQEKTENSLFNERVRIFIFVSRSVPLDVLKSYATDIEILGNANIRLVFRGLPRKKFLDRVLRKSPDCTDEDCVVRARLTISKSLFVRYGIDQVPAVVYDPDAGSSGKEEWLRVTGAAPLNTALNLFYRESGHDELRDAINRVVYK